MGKYFTFNHYTRTCRMKGKKGVDDDVKAQAISISASSLNALPLFERYCVDSFFKAATAAVRILDGETFEGEMICMECPNGCTECTEYTEPMRTASARPCCTFGRESITLSAFVRTGKKNLYGTLQVLTHSILAYYPVLIF